jgi:hypothetical protein
MRRERRGGGGMRGMHAHQERGEPQQSAAQFGLALAAAAHPAAG